MKKISSIDKSPLRKAYALLGANDPVELSKKYTEEDQKIMHAQRWDYHNPKLITNKIQKILETIDLSNLSVEENYWRLNILWFWYHHAISCAIWRHKDKRRAQKYSSLALRYQPKNHPNKITRLLYLLVRNRFSEAKRWGKTIKTGPEKTTALRLLKFYNKGGFFT